MIPIDLTPDTRVGEIAAILPGAAALFRAAGIDFCCGGDKALAAAANSCGEDTETLLARLRALAGTAEPAAPAPTPELIGHIVQRYHDVHRRELAELVALAEKVERVHAGHPEAPAGLAALLAEVRAEMEDHMQKEERMLFPMMLRALPGTVVPPVARMRAEHDDHGVQLAEMKRLTHGFQPPEGACRSWRALYAGLGKFADDLVSHVHLENNVLFPRFEAASA